MDVPSAFLHTPVEPKYPKVYMVLQGRLAKLMVKVYTKLHRKFVSTDSKGYMISYVEIQKALHRMIKYALLLYMKLVGYLTRPGFKLNPYDLCVMKKIVGESR